MTWSPERIQSVINSLDDMTDRTQGDVADLLSLASEYMRESVKPDTSRLVPIPVYEFIAGDKHAIDDTNPGHNAKRVLVEATPGTEVELVSAISSGALEKLLLIETKQDDRFIWPQGIMDAGLLYKMPFDGITIRDNSPLELYFNTAYATPHDGGETFSCCFMGRLTIVDQERYDESKRLQAKISHFVHEDEFERWLPDTPQGEFLTSVLRQYSRGEEPDLTHTILDEVTVTTAAKMSSPEWLKLLQQHLQRAGTSDSFVKQVLFQAQVEEKRRARRPGLVGPTGATGSTGLTKPQQTMRKILADHEKLKRRVP